MIDALHRWTKKEFEWSKYQSQRVGCNATQFNHKIVIRKTFIMGENAYKRQNTDLIFN